VKSEKNVIRFFDPDITKKMLAPSHSSVDFFSSSPFLGMSQRC